MLGHSSPGDGGGGLFFYDSTSSLDDDDGIVVKPAGVTTGRWIRLSVDTIDANWYGAIPNLSSDSTVPLQNALNAALTYRKRLYIPSGLYFVNDQSKGLEVITSSALEGWGLTIVGEIPGKDGRGTELRRNASGWTIRDSDIEGGNGRSVLTNENEVSHLRVERNEQSANYELIINGHDNHIRDYFFHGLRYS